MSLLLWISFALGGQELFSRNESVQTLHSYGYCIVQEEPDLSRRLLTVPPGSAAERDLVQTISTDRCLSGRGGAHVLDFGPQLLRGVVAEQLYGIDVQRNGWARARDIVAPFNVANEQELEGLGESGRRSLRALDFAQCIAAAAPQQVEALLNSEPTSNQEERAFQQLAPHLNPCLPQGARMSIVRPQLRGFLAEAAYRLAYAASDRGAR